MVCLDFYMIYPKKSFLDENNIFRSAERILCSFLAVYTTDTKL